MHIQFRTDNKRSQDLLVINIASFRFFHDQIEFYNLDIEDHDSAKITVEGDFIYHGIIFDFCGVYEGKA